LLKKDGVSIKSIVLCKTATLFFSRRVVDSCTAQLGHNAFLYKKLTWIYLKRYKGGTAMMCLDK
jgi:hypothetical protein